MRKYIASISIVLILCALIFCVSCDTENVSEDPFANVEGVKMTAVIKNIAEKIEVEVIEGEYEVSGIYWVNAGYAVYLDRSGNPIDKSALNVGDVVEITYTGQVAMSYPPQISAMIIQLK